MKFLTDDEGLAINVSQITAIKIKPNKNDGSYKNSRDYPFVADVHVSGKDKPFTIFLTGTQERELSQFVKERGSGA